MTEYSIAYSNIFNSLLKVVVKTSMKHERDRYCTKMFSHKCQTITSMHDNSVFCFFVMTIIHTQSVYFKCENKGKQLLLFNCVSL